MKETFLTIQPPLRLVFIVAFLVWLVLSVYKFAMCKFMFYLHIFISQVFFILCFYIMGNFHIF